MKNPNTIDSRLRRLASQRVRAFRFDSKTLISRRPAMSEQGVTSLVSFSVELF